MKKNWKKWTQTGLITLTVAAFGVVGSAYAADSVSFSNGFKKIFTQDGTSADPRGEVENGNKPLSDNLQRLIESGEIGGKGGGEGEVDPATDEAIFTQDGTSVDPRGEVENGNKPLSDNLKNQMQNGESSGAGGN